MGGLPGSASHVMVDILAVEGSRVGFHVPREKEEEHGKGEEAKSEFVPALAGESFTVVSEIRRKIVNILFEVGVSVCDIVNDLEKMVFNVVIDSAMCIVLVSEVDGYGKISDVCTPIMCSI